MVYIIAGASGVLGSAIAEDLSKNNELFLIGRDKEKILKMSEKYDCKYAIIDLNNPIPQREFKNVIDPDVEIKGLINCIGSILIKPLHGTSIEEYNEVINTNLFSSFYLLSTFAKRMKNGSALFFSSVAASLGLSNHEVISAAKSGVEGFVRSSAATYSKDNLRINAIAPSIMDSNMSKK
ncbi:MAG: SDR family oxidoreductase, partial [SAR202 cluster bacterium]|nr:SDR family oxidoreductase [SAR202 cluster bacterium]